MISEVQLMLRLALILVFGLCLPGCGWAGAWPQGKGNLFLSFGYEWTTTRDDLYFLAGERHYDDGRLVGTTSFNSFGYGSIYGEYGLTDRLSLGIDAGEEDAPHTFQWIAFAAYALTPADWRLKASAELGWGRREFPADPKDRATLRDLRDGGTEVVWRPGLSLGYGFATGWGGGWATLDLRQEQRQTRDETVNKADLTLGLAPSDTSLVYVQLQYSDYPLADATIRLVPSYVRKFGPQVSIETALLADVWGGGDRLGVRLGLWLQF